MKIKVLWTVLMAFALTCTLAISAGAQDRDDQNRDHDQNRQVDQNHDQNRSDRDQWQNRNGWESRTYAGDQHPDGWNHGRKTKSSYCEHANCYQYSYQGSPYYYYRDDNGQMIVRRKHHQDRDHDNHQ
jgi:Ni/Co efflux regulator RcnB